MAVLIEGYSLIVRNSTLEQKYPGGLAGYRHDCPNGSFCADESLCRVGFMVRDDADVFIAQLAARGLTPFRKETAEDVALMSAVDGPLVPCDWLELGKWGDIALAWLAGDERGELHAPAGWSAERRVQQMSAEEARERLEFVRSDGNVDVYRDKITGQEWYVGRTAMAEQDATRHRDLYQKGCDLIQGLILLDDRPPAPMDAPNRQRLQDAIAAFEEVVQINPANWNAMWLLGKIYQRLGDFIQALDWFARAHRVNPEQPDVAREAAIAAMESGQPAAAIPFCERAIEAQPEDAGLRANLALALLFSGRPRDAHAVAADALARDPADGITQQIVGIINEVLAGTRACPRHVRDLQ